MSEPKLEEMTLRDLVATFAMQGFLASTKLGVFSDDRIARASYKLAEAMLQARSEKEQ
jgi:hypothetical protein